jgi:hypothetical protein
MKIDVQTFVGEAPHVSPRLLPPGAAQSAINCKLETGDVMAWRQFVSEKVLAAAATTIHKVNGQWYSWNADVDVARGLIPGDTNYFTFMTSPGLYSTPRYTTHALATSGAEPYPFATRPVGMPAPTVAPSNLVAGVDPTPTSLVADVTDSGGVLATSWSKSPPVNSGGRRSEVVQSGVTGNPAPSYTLVWENNVGDAAWMYRNFGIATAAVVNFVCDFQFTSGDASHQQMLTHVMNEVAGSGLTVGYASDSDVLSIIVASGWNSRSGSTLSSSAAVGGLAFGTWYTLNVAVVVNADTTQTVTATIYQGATLKATVTATNTFSTGAYCGFVAEGSLIDAVDEYRTWYDNIHVTASGTAGYVPSTVATSYVYTFVNSNVGGTGGRWESAPSPASVTLVRPDGISVTLTTPTTHAFDALYGIDKKAIYRAITGATGTVYFLVAEIALGTATYVDALNDSEISNPGTVLPSEDWDLPPAGMKGIISLPNDCMAGFFANQLCFSARGHPHAWPVAYRLTTDTDIVAIANIDNTIVIGTQGRVQVATGNDPSSYSMSKPGEPQACVSKRSMTYVDGYGVVFASPDGFQVCAGSAGNVRNATRGVFTKEQWEALTPSSIHSAVYDGILFFWFTGSTPDAGYALDTTDGGFGLISLAHHAAAAHIDPLADTLNLILDQNNEPVEALLPIASTAVATSTTTIYRFDSHATNRIRYLWRGKLNLLPHETTFHFAKVEAEEFSNLVLRVYGDGALIYAKRVTSAAAFRVPALTVYSTYELALVGTSRGRTAQLAQAVAELD